jgi:hypothetical protein
MVEERIERRTFGPCQTGDHNECAVKVQHPIRHLSPDSRAVRDVGECDCSCHCWVAEQSGTAAIKEGDKVRKPECELIGTDGNVFSIIAQVSRTLRNAGLSWRADEFKRKAVKCGSYDEVLQLLHDYVEPF